MATQDRIVGFAIVVLQLFHTQVRRKLYSLWHNQSLYRRTCMIDPYRMMRTDGSARKATLARSCMHGVCGSISTQPAVKPFLRAA